jgi:hypothetical protein
MPVAGVVAGVTVIVPAGVALFAGVVPVAVLGGVAAPVVGAAAPAVAPVVAGVVGAVAPVVVVPEVSGGAASAAHPTKANATNAQAVKLRRAVAWPQSPCRR